MRDAQAHIVVQGRVQGVNYRGNLLREAEQRAVRGWVQNRWDGSVEAILQGSEEAVNAVLAWARVGSRSAVVESVEITWSEPEGYLTSFEIRG